MDIFINNAILHVLDRSGGGAVYSDAELDVDSDICAGFITKHIKKLLSSGDAKDATFSAESKALAAVAAYKAGEINFKDFSRRAVGLLDALMADNPDIPPGDALVAQFERGDDAYIAIIKLGFKEFYTHSTSDGERADNQIVKMASALPFGFGSADCAVLIPYDPMVLRVIEKPALAGGETRNYFSELFLEAAAELSKKEAAEILEETAAAVVADFFKGDAARLASVKNAVVETSDEADGVLSVTGVAARAFEDEGARAAFVESAKEMGLSGDVSLGAKFVRSKFGSHRFKAHNGVELKLPSELAEDPEAVVFERHDDGSVTIVLKDLRFGDL